MDMLENRLSFHIGKIQVLHLKGRGGVLLLFLPSGGVKPFLHLRLIIRKIHGLDMLRLIRR